MAPRKQVPEPPFDPFVRRVIVSIADYDPELKAHVIPWAHRLHAWAGLVFVFDDESKLDMLVYLAANTDGKRQIHVLTCRAHVAVNDYGEFIVNLDTSPDPATDRVIHKLDVIE